MGGCVSTQSSQVKSAQRAMGGQNADRLGHPTQGTPQTPPQGSDGPEGTQNAATSDTRRIDAFDRSERSGPKHEANSGTPTARDALRRPRAGVYMSDSERAIMRRVRAGHRHRHHRHHRRARLW